MKTRWDGGVLDKKQALKNHRFITYNSFTGVKLGTIEHLGDQDLAQM